MDRNRTEDGCREGDKGHQRCILIRAAWEDQLYWFLLLAVFLATLSCIFLHLSAAEDEPRTLAASKILSWARGELPRIEAIKQYEATLESTEKVQGRWLTTTSFVQVSFQPYRIFYRYTAPADVAGREAQYTGGNFFEGRMRSGGRWFSLPIDGPVARRRTNHSINELGFSAVLQIILREAEGKEKELTATVTDVTVAGRPCKQYSVTHPTVRVLVCVDTELRLPVRIEVQEPRNGQYELKERFEYRNVRLN